MKGSGWCSDRWSVSPDRGDVRASNSGLAHFFAAWCVDRDTSGNWLVIVGHFR